MTHTCHWIGCKKEVPPAMWGCKQHWFTLPIHLRKAIWKTYVPGQEITKTPSKEYIEVAIKVREWVSWYQALAEKVNKKDDNPLEL